MSSDADRVTELVDWIARVQWHNAPDDVAEAVRFSLL